MASTTLTSPSSPPPDIFITLLFSLPAELRLEIYSHALAQRSPKFNYFDCRRDDRCIQWLAYSPAIFHEAAPLLYDITPLCFPLEFG